MITKNKENCCKQKYRKKKLFTLNKIDDLSTIRENDLTLKGILLLNFQRDKKDKTKQKQT